MDPLLIGGLIAAAAAGAAVVFGRLRKVKVPRNGTWAKPPSVRYEPGVKPEDVKKALQWWRDLGHEFDVVDSVLADVPINDGEIRIRIDPAEVDRRKPPVVENAEVKSSGRGVTDTEIGPGGKIRHSTIILYENNALVLTSEIGHSLGFGHPKNAPTGHMLAGNGRIGWDDHRGLEA